MRAAECDGALFNNLCPNKGELCCVPDPRAGSDPYFLKPSQFLAIVGDTKRNAAMFYYLLAPNARPTCFHRAIYVVEHSYVTRNFSFGEEPGNESSFTKYDNNGELGNDLPGDGAKYRPRGFVGLNGKKSYISAGLYLGLDLRNDPELAAFPYHAGKIAQWYLERMRFDRFADGTFYGLSRLVHAMTGGNRGLSDRLRLAEQAADILGCGKVLKGYELPAASSTMSRNLKCKPTCVRGVEGESFCGCNGKVFKEYKHLCDGPVQVECCDEYCNSNLDLTFVVDSSGSITPDEFAMAKRFVAKFIQAVSVNKEKTRVAIVNYSNRTLIEAYLNSFYNEQFLFKVVENMQRQAETTNTADALRACKNAIYKVENGMRESDEGVTRLVLLITDGESNNVRDTIDAANQLKASNGILVHSIGVGTTLNVDELVQISSSGTYYLASSYESIDLILDNVLALTCNLPAEIGRQTKSLTVNKHTFRYFKHSLKGFEANRISIVVDSLVGATKLFVSFDRPNPNDLQIFEETRSGSLIYESSSNKIVLDKPFASSYIYIGVKGLGESNQFVISIIDPGFVSFSTSNFRGVSIYVLINFLITFFFYL